MNSEKEHLLLRINLVLNIAKGSIYRMIYIKLHYELNKLCQLELTYVSKIDHLLAFSSSQNFTF